MAVELQPLTIEVPYISGMGVNTFEPGGLIALEISHLTVEQANAILKTLTRGIKGAVVV